MFLTVLLIVHQKSFCFDKGVDAIEAGDNLVGGRKLCADFPQKFCATMYYIRYYILNSSTYTGVTHAWIWRQIQNICISHEIQMYNVVLKCVLESIPFLVSQKIHKYSIIYRYNKSFFTTEVAMSKMRQLSSNCQKLGK